MPINTRSNTSSSRGNRGGRRCSGNGSQNQPQSPYKCVSTAQPLEAYQKYPKKAKGKSNCCLFVTKTEEIRALQFFFPQRSERMKVSFTISTSEN